MLQIIYNLQIRKNTSRWSMTNYKEKYMRRTSNFFSYYHSRISSNNSLIANSYYFDNDEMLGLPTLVKSEWTLSGDHWSVWSTV